MELIERLRALRPQAETPRDHVGFVATAAGIYFLIAAVIEVWRFLATDIITPVWRVLRPWLFVLILSLGLVGQALAGTAPYYNCPSEPAFDSGSDATVKFCEDFTTGWYITDHRPPPDGTNGACATSGNQNPAPTGDKGWCGNPGSGGISLPTSVSLSAFGATIQAARMPKSSSGPSQFGASNMGDHATLNFVGLSAWYARMYYYADTGYQWSGQKVITWNNRDPGAGGIDIANTHCNCGAAGRTSSCNYQLQVAPPQDECLGQNISSLTIVPGHWYFMEHHIVLGGAGTGEYRLWMNDCGTDGTTCGASPVLRTQRTNITYPSTTAFRNFVIDQWANSPDGGSNGTDYITRIVVRTSPIGFFSGSPASPHGFILRTIIPLMAVIGLAAWHFAAKATL